MKNKTKNRSMDKFFNAVLSLKSVEDCYLFFDDICTINELQALAQRMEVALMLTEGKTYIEIGELTGASTATISRVNRALNYGASGYSIVIDRMRETGHEGMKEPK